MKEIDPEGELAFCKRLLDSPLGKLGKSLTGNIRPGPASAAGTGSSRRSRARRSNNDNLP